MSEKGGGGGRRSVIEMPSTLYCIDIGEVKAARVDGSHGTTSTSLFLHDTYIFLYGMPPMALLKHATYGFVYCMASIMALFMARHLLMDLFL